jgi:hypothetical protein
MAMKSAREARVDNRIYELNLITTLAVDKPAPRMTLLTNTRK